MSALFGGWNGLDGWIIESVFVLASVVALAHVVILGIPTFVLLIRRGGVDLRALGLAGFVEGCIPISVLAWPGGHGSPGSEFTYGQNLFGSHVTLIDRNVVTAYGWLNYGLTIFGWGLLGLLAALTFGRVYMRLSRRQRDA